MKRGTILAVCLLGLSAAGAETVYRSVDADGNVTFSTLPPENANDVEKVELAPPPSQERVEDAMQRQQRMLELVDEGLKERNAKKEARATAVSEAEQAVKDAQQALTDAKKIGPEDRLGGTGSGLLSPEYLQRVKQAEERLAVAKTNLAKARGGRYPANSSAPQPKPDNEQKQQ